MSNTSESWREVGSKLEAIGLKLKLHYQQEHEEREQMDEESGDALRKLTDAIDDAFDALGTAAKDDAVKADVREAGQALSNAVASTFAEASDSLRRAFRKKTEPTEE